MISRRFVCGHRAVYTTLGMSSDHLHVSAASPLQLSILQAPVFLRPCPPVLSVCCLRLGCVDLPLTFNCPSFNSELDERLTQNLKKYLVDRGVDTNTMEALADLKNDKEEREYGRWLKGLKSFVSK